MSQAIEMTQLSTHRRMLPWLMWGCGAAFYFYEFILSISPSVMGPFWMQDFSMSPTKLGILASIWFWAYALMQIPAGVLLDRLGPHRLLASASAVLVLGCIMFSMAHSCYKKHEQKQ